MIRALIAAAAALLSASPALAGQQTIRLKTADGCALEAWYLAPSSGAPVFVNTHGLGSGKSEWAPLHYELKKRGWGYLSLDLRGHGASVACGGRKADYRFFGARDWQNASRDIEAAAAWLVGKKISASRLVFCGASVGANLSLKAAAELKAKPAALALLSPGLEYAAVRTEPLLTAGLPRLFLAASPGDGYAWQSANRLAAAAARLGAPVVFAAGADGHGVDLFREPALLKRLLDWAAKEKK